MKVQTVLSIKGMVCNRCIQVVSREFEKLGIEITGIKLGAVEISGLPGTESLKNIHKILNENGLELIYSKKDRMIRKIKDVIDIAFSNSDGFPTKQEVSSLLSFQMNHSYDYLSEMFSESEGITLEKYILNRRLEKVKELLVYSGLTLTEIAFITGFSSVHHLSNQFKELTGLPPSHFRSIKYDKDAIIRGEK